MKKRFFCLTALLLCLLLCFVSCNNNEVDSTQGQNETNTPTPDTEPPVVSKSLDYTLSDDGSYYIVTGIGTYDDYNLIIPEEHEGKPVKDIEAGAFYDCLDIITVTIPDTITVITNNVFTDCRNLVTVTIGKNVTEIKEYAFRNCHKLVEVINNSPSVTITNDETNGSVGLNALSISNAEESYTTKISFEENGYILYTNGDAKYLMGSVGNCQRIVVDNGINGIFKYAFPDNGEVVWLEVNSSLDFIGEYAFNGCYNLLSVVLREDVLEIGEKAFQYCRKLYEAVSMKSTYIERGTETGYLGTAVNIYNSGMEYISKLSCTDDGFVFVDLKIYSYIGDEAEITLPQKTEYIGDYAFSKNSKIKKVTFNGNLDSVGDCAFEDCIALENVVFWKSSINDPGINRWGMRNIGIKAFSGCTALKEICLPKEVNYISKDAFLGCNELKIFCLKGTPGNDFQTGWHGNGEVYYYSFEEPQWEMHEYRNYWHYADDEKVIWERPE